MKGWLWRKWKAVGNLFESRTWDRQYFVLRGPFLYYSEQSSDDERQDFICLKDATTQIFVHHTRMYCFEISHPERRTIYLDAKDDEEKYEWIRAIALAAAGPVNPPATASMYYRLLGLNKEATVRDIGDKQSMLVQKAKSRRRSSAVKVKKAVSVEVAAAETSAVSLAETSAVVSANDTAV